ncbi:nose resistant to fluoxetine protein 6-like [Haemaphysalis longicornis]
MRTWRMLLLLALVGLSLLVILERSLVDGAALAISHSNGSSQSVRSPDPWRENLAATVRHFSGSLVHNVPPWVRQRLLEAPVSTECSLGLLKMLRGLSDLEPWALRMADSTGKVSSGMLTGSTVELGSFDECLDTVVRESDYELVRAQYCSLYLHLSNDTSLLELLEPAILMTDPKAKKLVHHMTEPLYPGSRWGICVVDDCSQEELESLARSLIGNSARPEVKYCTTSVFPAVTASQTVVMAIFGAILFLMATATVLDVYAPDCGNQNFGVTVLRSFSVPANLKLLTSTPMDKTSDSYTLRFMHGIRAISIFYVVFGHALGEYSFASGGSLFLSQYADQYDSVFAAGCILTVDTFFFLGGYLLSFGLSNLKISQGRVKTTVVVMIRRWYRLLLPMVFVACGFSLLPLFVRGPTTDMVYDMFYTAVEGYWWAFLLKIRNFFREISYGVCSHTWYISADYQLFVVALLVHQLRLRRRAIVAVLAVLSVAGCSFVAWQMYSTRHAPFAVFITDTFQDYLDFLTDVYMLPSYHAASYFGGCITFFIVQKYKNEKMAKNARVLLWTAVVGCYAACVIYRFDWTRGAKHSILENVLVGFWDRIIWTSGLAALTFLCASQQGGVVQRMLSCAPLAVLSRLSFSIYLIHFPFIFLAMNAQRERNYVIMFNTVSNTIAVFVWSSILALGLFLACEAPLGRLDKVLWAPPAKKRPATEGEIAQHQNICRPGRELGKGHTEVVAQ